MPRRYTVFFVFLLAYFLSYFFRSTNAVIADDLVADLSLGPEQLGLMTGLFFASFAGAQLPLGPALDRFGSRWVTPLLMLSAVLGSVLFALAPSFGVLALGRALIGLGMAGVLMGALKAFSGWFSARQFATVQGIFVSLGSAGALAAATPLALFNEAFGWRAIFWLGAVITLLSLLAVIVFSRNAPDHHEQRAVRAGGLADIFADIRFWRLALLNFAIVGSLFAYQGLWAGPFMKDVLGLSRVKIGNVLLILSGGATLGYFVSGWVAARLGLVRVLVGSVFLVLLTQVVLAAFRPAWGAGLLSLTFGLFGFFAAFGILMFAHARQEFPEHMTGRAITAINLFGIGGSALLQWLLGVVIGRFPEGAQGSYPPEAYTTTFVFTAGLGVAALLFYLPFLSTAGRGLESES